MICIREEFHRPLAFQPISTQAKVQPHDLHLTSSLLNNWTACSTLSSLREFYRHLISFKPADMYTVLQEHQPQTTPICRLIFPNQPRLVPANPQMWLYHFSHQPSQHRNQTYNIYQHPRVKWKILPSKFLNNATYFCPAALDVSVINSYVISDKWLHSEP